MNEIFRYTVLNNPEYNDDEIADTLAYDVVTFRDVTPNQRSIEVN